MVTGEMAVMVRLRWNTRERGGERSYQEEEETRFLTFYFY
jgi:hypothetical protein